ncbi:MAG: baseplate J/gp47 family protein [Longimicrobiaceae bacterium]
MDPHAGRIVLNGAVSQYARALAQSGARRVRVDGRGQAELLAFAARFGELVWFYATPDDRPEGDWSAFFLADPAALGAALRRAAPRAREAALAALAARLRGATGEEEKRALLRELFGAPLALARQVDGWLRVLGELGASGPAERLHRRLSEAVRGHLAPALRRLRAWDAGAAAREALGAPVGADYGGLLPLWELEGVAPDPSPWRGPAPAARIDQAAERVVEAFAAFVDALAAALRGAAELEAAAVPGEQRPPLALWSAFVALFRTAQRTLATLTPRYARFYYHRVLREGLRGPFPDRVYLAFTLAGESGSRATVPRGTLFPAGADADGQEVLYAADRALGVTAAALARLRMLRALSGPLVEAFTPAGSPPPPPAPLPPGAVETVPVQRVLASVVDLAAAGDGAGWPTFGSGAAGTVGAQATAPATLGFAVATPELLLGGGRRRVAVAVDFTADEALWRRLAAVAALTGAGRAEVLRQVVEGAFDLDLSTAEGWLRVEVEWAEVVPVPGGGTFTLHLELPPTLPAIVPLHAGGEAPEAEEGAEPRPNPAPGLPTLQATLRAGTVPVAGPLGTAEVHPLPFLEPLRVAEVEVRAWVWGLADLALANTDGEVGGGGAFPVFGAVPAVGSFLELRSAELFSKVPRELAVTLSWVALPPNDTGFAGWYAGWKIGLDGRRQPGLFDNAVFQGRMRVTTPGAWELREPGSPDPLPWAPVHLFRTREACQDPVPLPAAPLCPETRFGGLPVARTKGAPVGYDPAASALRLELSDPPYAFGNDLYAANVLDAVLRELPDGCACQQQCMVLCAPLDEAAAALALCLEACAGSPPGDPCLACLEQVGDRLAARAEACRAACGAASPPGGCEPCALMEEGVRRIDDCIARAAGGQPAAACVEACRAWLAQAYAAALSACVAACMRPGEVRYPSDPWLPQAERVTVDYVSSCRIDPDAAGACGALFHLEPFGGWGPMADEAGGVPLLLPRAGAPASLLLGFDALAGGDTLTLLFQLAAPGGTAEPATPPPVRWSWLGGDRWHPLAARDVPADTTHGLQSSGVVALQLPPLEGPEGTRLPGGGRWLRCAAEGEPAGFPWTVGIFPHAGAATWVDAGEGAGMHLAEPLPAGTITATVQEVAGVGSVLQPMPSFGGRPPETERGYQLRLSERLRHKERAAQPWDYERLALERFPQLWKARALPARGASGPAPGSVLVVVVAGEAGNESADPTMPRAPSALLGAVQEFLAERATPFAGVEVVNPAYVRVTVAAEVAFRDPGTGGDAGGGVDRLNADLVAWLSPWFYGAERAEHEGSYAFEGDVSWFIQSRPYVAALLSLELRHDPAPSTLEWYFLTSAGRHDLRERTFTGGYP